MAWAVFPHDQFKNGSNDVKTSIPVPTATFRLVLTVLLSFGAVNLATVDAFAAKQAVKRDLNKEFDELTPSEQIAIRAAAKAAYKGKKLSVLQICADPGNMPLSNIKEEGFQNKMANVLAEALGARIQYYWRPFIERGLTRQTFDETTCDLMFDMPANYGRLLTTAPIYKTTYVLAYRNDKGLSLTGLDDPKLKDLKIGVFQTSGIREALAKRGIVNNVSLQIQTHDGDLVPEHQPWYVVQNVLDGKLDVAAVWGPFAGWLVKMKHEPLTIEPVNLMEHRVPLEFELAIGVRKTDVLLKYMLDFALEDKKDEIAKILTDYGVPLVQCSRCLVPGDLPAHGNYPEISQTEFKPRPDLASPDQLVTKERVESWLEQGADINQELSNATNANDADRVKFLIEKGADVNALDSQGYAPIHTAARQKHDELIKLLIANKADVNKVDNNGMTPLLLAVMRDHVPSIKVLLENGADIEAKGPEGSRPLALAIAENRYEAAKALLDAGADVKSPVGPNELTPLLIVAGQTSPAEGAMFLPGSARPIDIAQELIEKGADVNAKSKEGVTPLMVAAANNNPPMIGLLIEAGADINAKNNQGKTAKDVAEMNDNAEAAQAIKVLGTAKSAAGAPAAPSTGSGQGSTSQ
jgi:quinoprotein dehydrogenase-associated probable ABC transporter substrate-binding protein